MPIVNVQLAGTMPTYSTILTSKQDRKIFFFPGKQFHCQWYVSHSLIDTFNTEHLCHSKTLFVTQPSGILEISKI